MRLNDGRGRKTTPWEKNGPRKKAAREKGREQLVELYQAMPAVLYCFTALLLLKGKIPQGQNGRKSFPGGLTFVPILASIFERSRIV